MHEIGIDICFSVAQVRWDNASIPMQSVDKSTEYFEQELLFTQDPLTTDAESIPNILESKYCPVDLNKIIAGATYSAQVNKKAYTHCSRSLHTCLMEHWETGRQIQ
jgi:hypothetical protein